MGKLAAGRAAPADVVVLARRHHGAAVEGAAAPGARGQRGIHALEPQEPELEVARQRVDGSAVGQRVNDRRSEPIQPLVGVPLGRPLVDELGKVFGVPERRGVPGAPGDRR
jgi:hypothetical protein